VISSLFRVASFDHRACDAALQAAGIQPVDILWSKHISGDGQVLGGLGMAVALLSVAYYFWADPLRLRPIGAKNSITLPAFAIVLASLTVAFVVRDVASYVEACSSILGKH